MLAGIKYVEEGDPLFVKGQPVVDLHFTVHPGVIPLFKVDPLPLEEGADALGAV